MKDKNKNRVVLVFEVASDPHWMKDVVQFPNALSGNLGYDKATLISRPNKYQEIIAGQINMVMFGEEEKENIASFKTQHFSQVKTDPAWYQSACVKAAAYGKVLLLYPFYGDHFKGAKAFKLKCWRQLKKCSVVIKSDGTLTEKAKYKASLGQQLSDYFRYYFIDYVVCENEQIIKMMQQNQHHLNAKLLYIPNCPLDIYHTQQITDYKRRPDNFLFIGRVDDAEKGIELLMRTWISIFNNILSWKLLIAGPCSDTVKEFWQGELQKNNALDTVEWLGVASPIELVHLYNKAKVVVCSSRKESGPIILSEALLSGCAFIGTPVGEIPAALNGLPGVVRDEEELKAIMLEFATNEIIPFEQAKTLRERMRDRNWSVQTTSIANLIKAELS